MQFVHAHQLFPQCHVAVHLVHIIVDGLDQAVIDRNGHLGLVQGGLQRGTVLAGGGKKLQLTELGIQGGSDGIAPAVQRVIEGLEGVFAEAVIGTAQASNQTFLSQLANITFAVGDGGEAHIGVAEGGTDGVGSLCDFTGSSQQSFLCGSQSVILLMTDLLNRTTIGLQCRLGSKEAFQGFIGDSQDLRHGIGRGAVDGHQQGHGLVAHILIETISGIFVALAGGIVKQQTQTVAAFVVLLEIVQQVGGAAAQCSLEGRGLCGQTLQRFIFFSPGLIRGENILSSPGVFFFHFTSFRNSFFSHGSTS